MHSWPEFPVLAALAGVGVSWHDIVLNPTPTERTTRSALDVAPAAGADIALLVIVAAVVIGVVLVALRARRRPR